MAKPESRLQRRMRSALQAEFGGFWYKVWGGPFQPAGIPDLCGVVRPPPTSTRRGAHGGRWRKLRAGRPVYVEAKMPDGEVSAVQVFRMRELMDAGAAVCVATTVDEAVSFVREMLADDTLRFCFHCLAPRAVGGVGGGTDVGPVWLSCACCDRPL